MGRLEEIASVEGVNGVFIGPADLAASMGFPGQPNHPEVRAQIDDAIDRLKKIGVPSGILTMDRAYAQHCISRGTTFTAVGLDLSMMLGAARDLAGAFGRG
jgi:4-hydroxy-2-oxoheptanedioate aldolase